MRGKVSRRSPFAGSREFEKPARDEHASVSVRGREGQNDERG